MNISETGCWLSEDLVNGHMFDEKLAKAIAELIGKGQYVVDMGCGNGKYVEYFNSKEIHCWGIDGSPLTERFANCTQWDLSQPATLQPNADVVLSLEVGEHIPAQYEQVFLDNLCRPNPELIILSWAVEGQAGQGHVNCRNNDYIIAEMDRRGYSYDRDASHNLRSVSRLPWFKNTIMVFIEMPF